MLDVIYNSMIHAYAKHGDTKGMMACLSDMKQDNVSPDLITYNTVIEGFANQKDEANVLKWFQIMQNEDIFYFSCSFYLPCTYYS